MDFSQLEDISFLDMETLRKKFIKNRQAQPPTKRTVIDLSPLQDLQETEKISPIKVNKTNEEAVSSTTESTTTKNIPDIFIIHKGSPTPGFYEGRSRTTPSPSIRFLNNPP